MSPNERRALIAAAAAIGLSMTPADAARLVEPTGFAEMRQLVEAHPEIDQAIFPGLSAAPLLMGGKKAALKPQDVFNTSLWTGNNAVRSITSGIDSGEGSLVWIKGRTVGYGHVLVDSVRGASNFLETDTSSAQQNDGQTINGLTSGGYTLGSRVNVNGSGYNYAGWQFRRAPKFFDIIQYSGNGASSGRQIAHGLGVKPGMIFIKRTNTAANWVVYHHSMGANFHNVLNSYAEFVTGGMWSNTEPTDAHFTVGGGS